MIKLPLGFGVKLIIFTINYHNNWLVTKRINSCKNREKNEITEALRNESSCRYIVSGIIEMNDGTDSAILNYGDGTCDNIATVNINDEGETEITLRRRR